MIPITSILLTYFLTSNHFQTTAAIATRTIRTTTRLSCYHHSSIGITQPRNSNNHNNNHNNHHHRCCHNHRWTKNRRFCFVTNLSKVDDNNNDFFDDEIFINQGNNKNNNDVVDDDSVEISQLQQDGEDLSDEILKQLKDSQPDQMTVMKEVKIYYYRIFYVVFFFGSTLFLFFFVLTFCVDTFLSFYLIYSCSE